MNTVKQATGDNLRLLYEGGVRQVTVAGAVEAFLRAEMVGLSNQTERWYRSRLLPMAQALGAGRPLADLLEVDLLEWYISLDGRDRRYVGGASRPEIEGGLSADTKHGYVRACKRFFRWLFERGILAADLSAGLKLPKLPRRGKKGVNDQDILEILGASRENVRDYALMRFVESTGIRRGGAAHLLLSDLSLGAKTDRLRRRATVREKGDKERTVLMTAGALEALCAWLRVRPEIEDDHVFLGQKPGQPWRPLTENGVSSIYRRYKDKLGIAGKVSPHQWRHRWCRRRLQEGMGLKQVSQLAGHEDISVTAKFYGEFAIDELQDAYDQHVEDLDL